MAKIQLVVEIEERLYKNIIDNDKDDEEFEAMDVAFNNAKPLPKGHGRLGDLDELKRTMEEGVRRALSFVDLTDFVLLSPTIMKSDKGEEDEI